MSRPTWLRRIVPRPARRSADARPTFRDGRPTSAAARRGLADDLPIRDDPPAVRGRRRFGGLGRRRRGTGGDLERELAAHFDLLVRQKIAEGSSPREARCAARREFGDVPHVTEEVREVLPGAWIGRVARDLRHVARGLRRSPGFTAVVVSVLALGIGAATAVFSLVHGVLLAPLPFTEPQQLATVQVHIRELEDRYPAFPANLRALEAWADCRDACADVAAISPSTSVLENEGGPRRMASARVTANFFDLLGAAPAAGRTFQAADMAVGGPGAAILAHGLWQGAFGGDPDVVGRMLLLDDEPVEVLGVLPESFWLPDLERLTPVPGRGGGAVEIFRPLRYTPEEARRFGEFDHLALVRLTPGTTAEQAVPELTALTREAFATAPFTATPVVRSLGLQIVSDVRPALGWLLAAVALMLLAACVSVAGMLSARGLRRQREMAVRSALGGGSADLVRHALVESVLLAGLGGLAGLGVAHAALRLAVVAAPVEVPRLGEAAIDGLALALAAVVVGVCAVGCGLPQAWRASRTAPAAVLKADARAGGDPAWRRFGDLLVGAQVALTVLLLVAGGLLLASFVRVMQVDRGFDPASVVAVDLHLPASRYDDERRTRFQDELLARLAGAPAVASAGVTQRLPLEGEAFVENILPAGGAPVDPVEAIALLGNYRFVSPDYFQTLGMVLTRGRPFGEQDRTRPVAVVTAQTAARLWPGQDPIGRRFHREARPGAPRRRWSGLSATRGFSGSRSTPVSSSTFRTGRSRNGKSRWSRAVRPMPARSSRPCARRCAGSTRGFPPPTCGCSTTCSRPASRCGDSCSR